MRRLLSNLIPSIGKRWNLTVATIALAASAASASPADSIASQALRPVTGFYNIEIGRRCVTDTYLSPLPFSGTEIALSGLWTKALPANPRHLSMTFSSRAAFASMLNSPKRAREYDFHLKAAWCMEWQERLQRGWTVGIGGGTFAYGGLDYNTRNGNNPVAAHAMICISADASATRTFRIGKLPLLLSERVSIPLAGVFFMPQYTESYYEIYLGNHSGLTHFGHPANNFSIDNLLSVTLDFGRTALMLGYRMEYGESYANHLVSRHLSNTFVIGVIPGGIGLRHRRHNTVTPLY